MAHMWLGFAAELGEPQAAKNQSIIAGLMSPTNITEAKIRAAEWRPGRQAPESSPRKSRGK